MSDIVTLQTEINLFGNEISNAPNIDREPLAAGLYAQLKDITLPEFCSYFINGFDAMVDYAKLCSGEKTGQRISLLFNPHRLDTGTKRFPISLYQALKDERFVRGLARVVLINMRKGNTTDLLYASVGMGVQGTSYVQEFPPHVARDLALKYKLSANSSVLDPCAGWGGRMLGFSAVVNSYTCCEPSTRTAAGLRQLLHFIHAFRSDFSAEIHEACFEDVELPWQSFDFAMTSPPYYDTEWYAPGEQQNSGNRYPTFDAWVAGFYAPLIHKTMRALKPGASFVLNIGSRLYPLNDKLFEIAHDHYAVQKQKGWLSASNGLGKDGEGETFYEVTNPGEVVVIVSPTESVVNQYTLGSPQSDDVSEQHVTSMSALDFAQQAPDDDLSTSERTIESAPEVSQAQPLPVSLSAQLSALDFACEAPVTTPEQVRAALLSRGHRLLTRDGKFFVSESSQLTTDDRAAIAEHREALIRMAMPWNVDSQLSAGQAPDAGLSAQGVEIKTTESSSISWPEDRPSSLALFLGNAPPTHMMSDWKASEPRPLDGINDIIVNFETDGLEWSKGHVPIGVTVGSLDGQFKQFLPFGFKGGGNLDRDTVIRYLQREVRNKNITNIRAHFDAHMGLRIGVDFEAQHNTMHDIAHTAALLDDHRKRFALDVLAKDYLGAIEIERVGETNMSAYQASDVAARAEYQATLVSQLHHKMWPQIVAENLERVHKLEDEIIYAVVEMEEHGARIDMELLADFKARCESQFYQLLKEISEEVGFPFQLNSECWKRLFEKFNVPMTFLKSGKESFKEDVVNEAIKDYQHPVLKKAHFASQLNSLNTKIFKPYTENIGADGILRFRMNQLVGEDGGTVSGRFSAPYVHQVPGFNNHFKVFGDDLFPRKLYIPDDGWLFYDADAAQIEYRIFAHHAQNKDVLARYAADPKMSFHKMVMGLIVPYKPDMVYEELKSLNFMKLYAGGVVKTAAMMGLISHLVAEEIKAAKTQRTDPRLNVAREIEGIYGRVLPEAGQLTRKASHLAMTSCDDWCNKTAESRKLHRDFPHRGYVKTLLGRRARFVNNYDVHKAFNRVDQGTGADILKTKIVEVRKLHKDIDFKLRSCLHDAIECDVRDNETAAHLNSVLNTQSFPELTVPILWEGKTGKNWAECK